MVALLGEVPELLAIPETRYMATLSLRSKRYEEIIGAMNQASDTMDLIFTSPQVVTFSSDGLEDGEEPTVIHVTADKDSEITLLLPRQDSTRAVCGTFGLHYLRSFVRATGVSERVSLLLCEDFPLRVDYAFGGGGFLRFYLAPVIQMDA